MKDKEPHYQDTSSPPEPFNSAVGHNQTIMGHPGKRADLSAMPKWIRVFYYGVITFCVLGFGLIIIALIFK